MKNIITTAILIFFMLTASGFSEDIKNSEQIALKDFISSAVKNDPVFEEILFRRLYLEYNEVLKLPADEYLFSLKSQYDVRYEDQDGLSASFLLSRLFSEKGTRADLEYATRSNSLTDNASELSFYISQPIGRNAFGREIKIQRELISLQNDIIEHQVVEAYEDYLASLIVSFYEWYELYQYRRISRSSYEENIKLLDNVEKRKRANIALQIDVNKVKLQVLGKKQSLLELESQYNVALNVISRSRGESISRSVIPVLSQDLPFADALQKDSKDPSRTEKILKLLLEEKEGNIALMAEELLPSIEMKFGVNISGDKLWIEDNRNSIFAAVSMDLPFTNEIAKARHKIAKISSEDTQLSNSNLLLELRTGLKNLEAGILREESVLELIDEKIKLAEEILKAESNNYSLGKVSLNDYISAVNVLDSNRFSRIAHLVKLKILKTEYLRLTDSLVSKIPTEVQ